MKKGFLIICFVALNLSLIGQIRDTIYLWPDQVPGETEIKHEAVRSPNNNKSVIRLTDVTNPLLVVCKPRLSVDNGNSVIVCPGGGYNILAIDLEGYEIAQWLNELGYTAYVLQYRVPKKRTEALYDLQRAIQMVRGHAAGETGKIGIIGFSAGGSLCARAATGFHNVSCPVKTDLDSVSARPDFVLLIYPAYLDAGENRTLTPGLEITSDVPPVFIFGAADDKHCNSSLVMAGALRDHEVSVELHILPDGGHGYGLRPGNVAAETWPQLAQKWLGRIMKSQ